MYEVCNPAETPVSSNNSVLSGNRECNVLKSLQEKQVLRDPVLRFYSKRKMNFPFTVNYSGSGGGICFHYSIAELFFC